MGNSASFLSPMFFWDIIRISAKVAAFQCQLLSGTVFVAVAVTLEFAFQSFGWLFRCLFWVWCVVLEAFLPAGSLRDAVVLVWLLASCCHLQRGIVPLQGETLCSFLLRVNVLQLK